MLFACSLKCLQSSHYNVTLVVRENAVTFHSCFSFIQTLTKFIGTRDNCGYKSHEDLSFLSEMKLQSNPEVLTSVLCQSEDFIRINLFVTLYVCDRA